MAQHRAARGERTWWDGEGADPDLRPRLTPPNGDESEPHQSDGFAARSGYGHAARLATLPDPHDRHRYQSPAGLPYRLPVDTEPYDPDTEPEPVEVPPSQPTRWWSVWDFATFLARRHPDSGTGWCGCGTQATACPVRYGLSMIDWRPDRGYR